MGVPTKAGIHTFTIVAEADGVVGDEVTLTLYVAYSDALDSGNQGGSILDGVLGSNGGSSSSVDPLTIGIAAVILLGLSVFLVMIKRKV